ncbi:MAG: LysM peptidoglycan-binding domain-containing protein [Candidatus Omnitrophica bacterium]|nr:LysM peptidoglycan-binding domain-containing protein [Candidatus Omnitrophota bacterium]
MNKFKLAGICVLASTMALSGCVTRTYNLTRDRVDQDLSSTSGNRGYLTGQAPEPKERTTTRTVRVFEIELGKTKSNVSCPATTPLGTSIEEPAGGFQEEINETQGFEKYTVAKNDTLQKISKKFYGTTKRWMKIYNANKNVLSAPDKLYPGQTLNIPSAPALKIKPEKMAETKENLK